MRIVTAILMLAVVGLAAQAARADIVTFSTGDASFVKLANDGYPSDYDTLTFTGVQDATVDLTMGIPVIAKISDVLFDVGPSSYGTPVDSRIAERSLSVSLIEGIISNPFVVESEWDGDDCHIQQGAATIIDLGDGRSVSVTPLSLDFVNNLGGSVTGELMGEFTLVPEPATMSLLALGGLAMLRRRK